MMSLFLLCMHKICHYRALSKMVYKTLLQPCTFYSLFLPCPVCQHVCKTSDSAFCIVFEASSYEDTQSHSEPLLFSFAYKTPFRSSISGAVDSHQSGQLFTCLDSRQSRQTFAQFGQTFTIDSHQSGQTFTIDSRQSGQTFTIDSRQSGQTFTGLELNKC